MRLLRDYTQLFLITSMFVGYSAVLPKPATAQVKTQQIGIQRADAVRFALPHSPPTSVADSNAKKPSAKGYVWKGAGIGAILGLILLITVPSDSGAFIDSEGAPVVYGSAMIGAGVGYLVFRSKRDPARNPPPRN